MCGFGLCFVDGDAVLFGDSASMGMLACDEVAGAAYGADAAAACSRAAAKVQSVEDTGNIALMHKTWETLR